MAESGEALGELASLAASIGPALAPVDYIESLTQLVESAREAFGAQACSIALLDAEQANLVFTVASGRGAESVIGLTVPVGVGIAGWVVSSGQSIEIAEVTRDPRFAREVAEQTGYLPNGILAAPLETESRVLGVVEVLDRDTDRPGSDRDLVTLAFFARHAALAIESARLFSDMGRLLLTALAAASPTSNLGDDLRRAARELHVNTDLAELADMFGALGRAGAAEQRLAVRIVSNVLTYTDQRPPA
jgi:GAF domain-containing protein